MDGYLPLRTTVYKDEDGEQRAFPHDFGPEYEEPIWVNLAPDAPSPILKTTKTWHRLERDTDE